MATNDGTGRDRILTTLAVLMSVMAISNFAKTLGQAMDPGGNAGVVFFGQRLHAGFVFFGQRLHGTANAIMGPVFGLILAAYAYGVWTMKHWVVPLAGAYAVYVILNLVLFTATGDPPPLLFMLGYAVVAIGVSSGGALYLYRNRDRLS